MATAYTNLLGFALPVTGELNGTWGDVVNNSITELVEDSIANSATASVASGDWTLTTTGGGVSNQARCAILIPTGSPGVSRNIIAPSKSKAYVVVNQSNAAVVVKGSATTGVSIAAGSRALVAWNGSDFVAVGVSSFSAGTTGLTPSTSTGGAVTLAGTLVAANGGTGQSSYTTGDILYASSSSALAKLPDVATGNALLSGGVNTAPAWGKVGLTTHVSGTLPIANGGTGTTSTTFCNLTTNVTGTLPIANGGTGTTSTAYCNLGSNVTGTLPVANGGIGLSSIASTSIPVANTANTYTTVTPAAGQSVRVNLSGTAWEAFTPTASGGSVTSVSGTGTVNGITLTGTVTSSGSLTLGGSLSGVSLASQVSGTLPIANGGTGSTLTAYCNLASNVTGTLPIANGGTGSTSTAYCNLASNVTGTLPVANGGTGITSFGGGIATWLGTPSSANLAAAVTDETGSGSLVFGTTPTITALREVKTTISASNIDLSSSNYYSKTISGTTTFTVSNVPSSGTSASFILDLTNGGSATVNWWSGVKWASGIPPTLTASGRDVLGFYTYDGGTTWTGLVMAKDVK